MTAQDADIRFDAVVLAADDNVATALRALAKGERARISNTAGEAVVILCAPVPFGHKFAIRPIEAGALVLKYGTSIGRAIARIERGTHVHTHNLISDRARPVSA